MTLTMGALSWLHCMTLPHSVGSERVLTVRWNHRNKLYKMRRICHAYGLGRPLTPPCSAPLLSNAATEPLGCEHGTVVHYARPGLLYLLVLFCHGYGPSLLPRPPLWYLVLPKSPLLELSMSMHPSVCAEGLR